MSVFEAVDLGLCVLSIPWVCGGAYLLVLTLSSKRGRHPNPPTSRPYFEIVVPAHDEEAGIAKTVQSLLALEWPRDRFSVTVVADNCSDGTAARAQAAGAKVLVRNDANLRGKGYALSFAYGRILEEACADAAVVVDADTVVSPNLLAAFALRMEQGAKAMQADYAVLNPHASWRTRLMQVALGMFHILRSLGRENLGLSCGLRGNGMCFTAELLKEVPHQAFSRVEDLEYGVALGQAGVRVHYAEEAHVYGEMVSGEASSRSQRERWEGGRAQFANALGWPLLRSALKQRSALLLDLALDVLVPPLANFGAGVFCVWGLAVSLSVFANPPGSSLYLTSFAVLGLLAYVLRGWQLSGTGLRGAMDLLAAPYYLAWKLTLRLRRSRVPKTEWVRTTREGKIP